VNPEAAAFCENCGASLADADAGKPPDPLVGSMVADRFLVEGRLGAGGMGVVYGATQTAIGRKVALKVLHPHLADETLYARFRNEAAAASRLAHPNTITVFDFGRTESGALYIAMELIEGTSLDEEIRRVGALDWQRAARIGSQICGSLQHAHEQGVVHRDLKPENVMLLTRGSETDVVKVVDFGIAKIVEEDGTDQRQALTKTGMVFGTPQYMSPEQIRGERVDPRSDIYSTGVILYRMLSGALPFSARTLMGVLTKHLMDPPPAFAEVSPEIQVPTSLESLVLQMLAKDPDERPRSMAEVAERIAALTVPIAPPAPIAPLEPTAPVTPVKAERGRGGKIAAFVVGALLLLGGGGGAAWYFLAGPGRTPPQPPSRRVMPPVAPPYVAPQYPATPPTAAPVPTQPPAVDTAPLPAAPPDPGEDEPEIAEPGPEKPKKPKKIKKPEKPEEPEEPEDPGDGKTAEELISAVKDKLGQLKKKYEDKIKGGKDGGS
jgi:serine/threonine-protein kinase